MAANHHVIDCINDDGTVGHFTKRDSSSLQPLLAKARLDKRELKCAALAATTLKEPAPPISAAPLAPLTRLQALGQRKKHAAAVRRDEAAEQLANAISSAHARSQPPAVTASDRMAALRLRLAF